MSDEEAVENDVLTRLETSVKEVETEAARPLEWAEGALKLDIASRQPDPVRVAKHLHQMCTFHAENFRRANYVKLAYVGRFYLTEVASRNPIGVTAAARSILELHALLRWVQAELARVASGPENEWRSRGQSFFDILIKARFGSTNPTVVAALAQAGVPDKLRQPYRVGECVKALAKRSGFEWGQDHYAFLCDWVHASESSQTASTAGARHGSTIEVGPSVLFLTKPAMILRHEYGASLAIEYVVDQTLSRALEGFLDGVAAIQHTTATPFSQEELVRLTGTPHGATFIPWPDRGGSTKASR